VPQFLPQPVPKSLDRLGLFWRDEMNLICRLGWHHYQPAYRDGRVDVCTHCTSERRISWTPIADPELKGRQLYRPKTRGEKA
jgi:hypothetical protein